MEIGSRAEEFLVIYSFNVIWVGPIIGLLLAHTRVPRRGMGTGTAGTFQAPFHPTGISTGPLSSPWGSISYRFHPLMDEIPVGDRGPVAILSPPPFSFE